MMSSLAAAQIPAIRTLNVDHVAHFVPCSDSAKRELEHLGFTVTPFSAQSHRVKSGGPLEPAGAGNRCVMMERGYLEFLTPTGATQIAGQLRAAMRRYVGVHLLAFGTSTPEEDHARLDKAGFSPVEPIALERSIETTVTKEVARFKVVRVPPNTMPEGRIQFCQHLTPQWLWQGRWTTHPNHAVAITGVILCVKDPQDAARRYGRFTGISPAVTGDAWRIMTARGHLLFIGRTTLERLGTEPPAPPCIAGYILESKDLAATGDYLHGSGIGVRMLGKQRLFIELPPTLGGFTIFEAPNSEPLRFT